MNRDYEIHGEMSIEEENMIEFIEETDSYLGQFITGLILGLVIIFMFNIIILDADSIRIRQKEDIIEMSEYSVQCNNKRITLLNQDYDDIRIAVTNDITSKLSEADTVYLKLNSKGKVIYGYKIGETKYYIEPYTLMSSESTYF